MRLASRTIWVLLALLVAATLDRQPDPPAANPNTAVLHVLSLHCDCWGTVSFSDSRPPSDAAHTRLASVEPPERFRGTDPAAIAAHVADSSPPISNRVLASFSTAA